MANVRTIEGIGDSLALKLQKAGIKTVEGLLKACADPAGRKNISEKTGISESQILKYTKQADLFRIKGVAGEYSEMLVASGVDTVPELAQRNPHNLVASMLAVNEKKELVRQVPAVSQVKNWVGQAAKLPRVIVY